MNQDMDRTAPLISNLQRREIQAPMAVCLLKAFAEVIGQDEAIAVASAAIQKEAAITGKTMAREIGGNTLNDLLHIIQEVWAGGNAIEFQLIEQTDQKLSFDVHRCRYAGLYDRLGLKEYGFCLSCNRDAPFVEGFNPHMKLLRTQTIMQGAESCDFRIVMD